jgi:hypothetical protein
MDPFTIATGLAGLLSLAIEINGILNGYIGASKSAPKEVHDLLVKVSALQHVLEQLIVFLRSEEARQVAFDKASVLSSVIGSCQQKIEALCKKLDVICKPKTNKMRVLIESVKWPLRKEECLQTVAELHQFAQTFEFSLVISHWYVSGGPSLQSLQLFANLRVYDKRNPCKNVICH